MKLDTENHLEPIKNNDIIFLQGNLNKNNTSFKFSYCDKLYMKIAISSVISITLIYILLIDLFSK